MLFDRKVACTAVLHIIVQPEACTKQLAHTISFSAILLLVCSFQEGIIEQGHILNCMVEIIPKSVNLEINAINCQISDDMLSNVLIIVSTGHCHPKLMHNN